MATIIIQNLDDEVVERLRLQARSAVYPSSRKRGGCSRRAPE
jgi:plasmid stability protein